MKKANVLVVAGAVLLVIGLAVVWVISQDADDGPDEGTVPVLVARADLSAGESGDAVVAAGEVSTEQVPASSVQPGALTSTTDLAGTILGTALAEGDQVLAASVRPANLRTGSITIPKDKQALALTVGFTEGVAGYVGVGDHVNIYVTVPARETPEPTEPFTRLLLTNVEVLDVSSELTPQRATETTIPGATPTRTGGQTLTLLLALDAQDAEKAVFATNLDSLWFTVLPKGQEDSTTDGVDHDTNYVEVGS